MVRPNLIPVRGAATLALLMLVGVFQGCSDDEGGVSPGSDDNHDADLVADSLSCVADGGWAVGPRGAALVYRNDPTYPELVVEVEARPGGLDFMACFAPGVTSPREAATYPPGYRGYFIGRCFDLNPGNAEVYLQGLDLRLTLPIPEGSGGDGTMDVPCAYYYDDDRGTWSIALPVAVDGNTMTVEAPYHSRWNWGSVDIYAADFELNLRQLLNEIFGEEAWAELEAAIHELYRAVIDPEVEMSCERVALLRNSVLTQMYADAEARLVLLHETVYAGCGPCPLTSMEFVNNLARYVALEMSLAFFEYVWYGIHDNEMIRWGDYIMIPAFLQAISYYVLNCNYECVFTVTGLTGDDLWIKLFQFHFARICMELIDTGLQEGYIDCK